MEPDESSGLSTYFTHQPPHTTAPPPQVTGGAGPTPLSASPTNGVLSNASGNNPSAAANATSPMVFQGSVPTAISAPMETVKRKRGRPRKYGTPEQAAAAKRLSSAASGSASHAKKKDNQALGGVFLGGETAGGASSSSRKSQLPSVGYAGQGFTPHIIHVAAGEDVGQKIMSFMQQNKRELCILSASGTISNASLRQPATSGGNVTYEGRFDILAMSGSYIRTDLGGRTGGLSISLATTDGHMFGGGVNGPLTAAGPVQVIVGSFSLDSKKDATGGAKGDASGSKLSPVGGASASNISFRSTAEPSHQSVGGQFLMPPRGMQFTASRSSEWRPGTGQLMHQSPENGDYDHLAD